MIFWWRELSDMERAADFRWINEDESLTLGITPNLLAVIHCEWLDKIIDKIIEGR